MRTLDDKGVLLTIFLYTDTIELKSQGLVPIFCFSILQLSTHYNRNLMSMLKQNVLINMVEMISQ